MEERIMGIPKKIHYIWIGNNPKPPIIEKCIESWKKYMPDFEVIEWNEQNYDVTKNAYIRDAYAQKKYAYVSDYMRFDILYQYGGIYLDTDVEFLKPIPEEILKYNAFSGMESSGKVSPGLIYACQPGDSIARKMMENYENDTFDAEHLVTVNCRITKILCEKGFVEEDRFQVIDGLAIYPSEIFCGYDLDVHEIAITERTVSVHHYAASWKKKTWKAKVQKLLKKVIGVENYRKLLYLKRKFKQK